MYYILCFAVYIAYVEEINYVMLMLMFWICFTEIFRVYLDFSHVVILVQYIGGSLHTIIHSHDDLLHIVKLMNWVCFGYVLLRSFSQF